VRIGGDASTRFPDVLGSRDVEDHRLDAVCPDRVSVAFAADTGEGC
jgi:hypothetical protein